MPDSNYPRIVALVPMRHHSQRIPQKNFRLLDGKPLELTAANFGRFVAKSEMPVVVDFWAPWCGPCKMMAPVFSQVAAEFRTRFRFVKVNTEVEQALAQQFAIRSIPTLAIFRGGAEVDRVAGAMEIEGSCPGVYRDMLRP